MQHHDEDYINGFRAGNPKLLNAFVQANQGKIIAMVKKYGGDQEDGEDIFQESMIVLYRKIADRNFKLSSALSTYFYGIARHLWLNKLKKKWPEKITSEMEATLKDDDSYSQKEEEQERHRKLELIKSKISLLGKGCQELLNAFYFEGLTLAEIVEAGIASTPNYAKQKKFRCNKQLRELSAG